MAKNFDEAYRDYSDDFRKLAREFSAEHGLTLREVVELMAKVEHMVHDSRNKSFRRQVSRHPMDP